MKKSTIKNDNLLRLIYFIVLVVLLLYLFFNKFGLVKYLELKSEIGSIETKTKKTELQIKKYEEDIKSLKKNDSKLEEVAREKFHMKKKNEKAFQFKDKKEK